MASTCCHRLELHPSMQCVASECSRTCKSRDCSLYTLQGLILEAIGPLRQSDPNPQVSLDQIEEAAETAIIILANCPNACNKTSLIRRTKILEEYNKELVIFAGAQERNWASAAPQLFGLNFLKAPAHYLQHLQLVRKVKQPQQNFQQSPSWSQQRGWGKGRNLSLMTTSILPASQSKD